MEYIMNENGVKVGGDTFPKLENFQPPEKQPITDA